MRFKIVLLILTAGAGSLLARDPALKDAPYLNAALPVEDRVNDLISRMTFAEKVGQLISNRGYTTYEIRNGEVLPSKELKDLYAKYPGACLWSFARADWYTGRNWKTGLTPDLLVRGVNMAQREAVERTRLGIPIRFDGAIHGLQVLGGLILPSGLGQAATFDRAIVKRGGSDTVEELLSYTQAGRVPGPTQDLARDPRFSRCEETYGEDPYLASELGYAYGMGIWERGGGNFGLAPRHFPGHGEGEGGQMAAPVHIGRNEMLNVILRAYEGPLRAHPVAVMTCYNLIDGIPGAIHGELINGWLRGKMGFDGVIVTNPPYGERLGDHEEAHALYADYAKALNPRARAYILSADEDFERHFHRRSTKKRKLYNGMIRCNLYMYF